MNIKEIKEKQKQELEQAINNRVKELKKGDEYKMFLKLVEKLESGETGEYTLNDVGLLNREIDVTDFFKQEDDEVREKLMNCDDIVHYNCNTISICLGYPIIINRYKREGEYKVYCEDIPSLRIEDIEDDKLKSKINEGCEKAGVFPYAIEVDYYGTFLKIFKY